MASLLGWWEQSRQQRAGHHPCEAPWLFSTAACTPKTGPGCITTPARGLCQPASPWGAPRAPGGWLCPGTRLWAAASPVSLPRGSGTAEQRLQEIEGSQGGREVLGATFGFPGRSQKSSAPCRGTLHPAGQLGTLSREGTCNKPCASLGASRGTVRGVPCEPQPHGGGVCAGSSWEGLSVLRRDSKAAPAWLISAFPEQAAYWSCVHLSGSRGARLEAGPRLKAPALELQELPKAGAAGASPLKPWCCCWAAIKTGGAARLPASCSSCSLPWCCPWGPAAILGVAGGRRSRFWVLGIRLSSGRACASSVLLLPWTTAAGFSPAFLLLRCSRWCFGANFREPRARGALPALVVSFSPILFGSSFSLDRSCASPPALPA